MPQPPLRDLSRALFRDMLIINTQIYPNIKEGERTWAERLGCVSPNYNVIAATPDSDFAAFGADWTAEDAQQLRTRGAVLLRPRTQGQA
ncbi:hypothetical protein BK022_03545 [Methylorubrum extorquens]|uniref:Uncharacterized protein n=1 Tax=Methylorubrum extorquens TaxID=408 RepID=A0A1S1PCL4_METEX|nr:hypothetical protein BK022_03545 [Methylorubrum extorquens]